MKNLTLKLVKTKNNKIEYSVLEQSESLREYDLTISYILDSKKRLDTIYFVSFLVPDLHYFDNTFYLRGRDIEQDEVVRTLELDKNLKNFLLFITKNNVKQLKHYFKKDGINFNLITNLYQHNIDSMF